MQFYKVEAYSHDYELLDSCICNYMSDALHHAARYAHDARISEIARVRVREVSALGDYTIQDIMLIDTDEFDF